MDRTCKWETFDVQILKENQAVAKEVKEEKNKLKTVQIKKKIKKKCGNISTKMYDLITCCISIADLFTGFFCFY